VIEHLRFSNFHSFYEETEVSFSVGNKPSTSAYDINLDDNRLNKVVAVVGSNGSGKTQLLRPFAFLSWFIANSFRDQEPDSTIPFRPHALHRDKISTFELNFFLAGKAYKYVLKLTREYVEYEALFVKTSAAYSYVFVRDKTDDGYLYKHKGFGLKPNDAVKIKKNASLISAAYIYGHDVALCIAGYFDRYTCNVTPIGRNNYHEGSLIESAEYFSDNEILSEKMVSIITNMDLGLSGVVTEHHVKKNKEGDDEKLLYPVGVHVDGESSFKLPFFEESSGTKSAYVLLRTILPVLHNGGIAIIDEMDNDLHPHMLIHILELFKFPSTNPNNAQLIFSCHTPEVLNILRKHQIYLVQKESLESEAWRLDEVVGLRSDDNLYAKYQAGALGAIPNI
jgi:AAA15 family ATPase/GTPase